jgi:hypothetical protein
MNDNDWNKQWRSKETYCLNEIRNLNSKLTNQDLTIRGYIVDPVQTQEVEDLCESYKNVYVISEQSGATLPTNCTAYTIPKSFYGTYYADDLILDREIIKDYNCFMNRIDIARQNWFYILYESGWLDRGYVSLNIHLRQGVWYPAETPNDVFKHYHQTFLSSYDYLYPSVEKIVPYKNFIDTNNQFEKVLDTKFSIVIETHYERSDSICFSEKTLRVLQLPRPWVLFGASGSIQKLRDMGFDVFDDFVDHSYDSVDTSQSYVQRQNLMIPEIEKLLQLQTTPAIIDVWKQKAQHNRDILKSWSQTWQTDFLTVLNDVYCCAMQTDGKYQ